MLKTILPLASLLVCTLGFASSADASYAITLDNYGTSGIPTWAGTGGTITVRTRINGVWATVCELEGLTNRSANHWCFVSSVFDWDDVEGIAVQTDSSDAFWLDQFHLWQNTGPFTWDLKRTIGVDNNTGWCLSSGSEEPSQYCSGVWSWSHYWLF